MTRLSFQFISTGAPLVLQALVQVLTCAKCQLTILFAITNVIQCTCHIHCVFNAFIYFFRHTSHLILTFHSARIQYQLCLWSRCKCKYTQSRLGKILLCDGVQLADNKQSELCFVHKSSVVFLTGNAEFNCGNMFCSGAGYVVLFVR